MEVFAEYLASISNPQHRARMEEVMGYRHPDVDAIKNLSLAIIVEQKRIVGNSRSTLGTITEEGIV